jgi:LysR family transcriptional regulator, cyn operon transcriptional activator
MNLRHLRAFAMVVDVGGFGRAAERLHLSQPALSRQIHTLELEFGVRLFDRIGRRARLTSQGEDLLRRSRLLLAEAESLGERARELQSGKTAILRVAATPQVIENLAPFLVDYRRRHPDVEVHFVEGSGRRLVEYLEYGEVHLSIMQAGTTRFESQLLYPMHVIAVLPSRHRLARRALLEIAELADEPLLLPHQGFAAREWFDSACDMAHIQPRSLIQNAAPHTRVALAATGYAIAILPSSVRMPREGVRTVPLVHRGASIGGWVHIAWDQERFLAPYAGHFTAELVDHSRRDFPGRSLVKRAPPLPLPRKH